MGAVRGQIRWVGAVRGQTGAARARWGRGTGGKMVGLGALGVGYQTGDGIPVRDGVPDKGWGSRLGIGFQTGGGIPDTGRVLDMG